METPKWLLDLRSFADSIPFGDIQPQIKKVKGKVVEVQTQAVETLRYEANEEAMKDIIALFKTLVEQKHSGSITMTVDLKEGNMFQIAFYRIDKGTY